MPSKAELNVKYMAQALSQACALLNATNSTGNLFAAGRAYELLVSMNTTLTAVRVSVEELQQEVAELKDKRKAARAIAKRPLATKRKNGAARATA